MAPTQDIDPAELVVALANFDRHGSLGSLLIGVLISALLLGVVTVQTYYYYTRFPDDHVATKALVAFIIACEYAQAITTCHTLYELVVTNYGNPAALHQPPLSLSISILFSGFIGPMTQAFFANRIRLISHQLIVPVICWVLSFLRFVGSVLAASQAVQMSNIEVYQREWKWLLTTILAVGAAVDIIIACTLSYFLMRQRAVAYKSTTKVIDKLIAWSIETGLITSVAGLAMLICFLRIDNFVWLGFFMFLGRREPNNSTPYS
ncbi:hypothetical protein BDV98DRAFT_202807 [Pterulicium gracile]|uniref:DUF6534 domain-containing protein n=1 Tax=Pterulicium gracile TaxID=1884261 RepID=A0A5C3QCC1_9AGAR|nr:hypothetical protein BDV98DRAFT_202807 [Pterula gracilis]